MTTLAEQIATLESRLAAHESRKVPLSADILWRIFNDHDGGPDTSILAVARAALVAAESPAGVEAAFEVWRKNYSGSHSAMLAAIRAAHDAAIDGGCGAARESAGPPWLADAAEALGKKGAALNWSQVIGEIRELVWQRDGFRKEADRLVDRNNTLCSEAEALEKDRDKWLAEAKWLEKNRNMWEANANAHRAEVERTYKERDDLRAKLDATQQEWEAAREDVDEVCADRDLAIKERDDLRLQLDALTRPIDGVEELGRIGWEAWQMAAGFTLQREDAADMACDNANAQAIASRVIGALRAAYNKVMCGEYYSNSYQDSALEDFDAAVASLKIEPAKVEASPVDTRPVVKVGQVWTFDGAMGSHKVESISLNYARNANGGSFMSIGSDGRPSNPEWTIVADAPAPPTPKREPFELRKEHIATPNEIALRDKVREIERRLEAGGL